MPYSINQIDLFSNADQSQESITLDAELEAIVISGLQTRKSPLKICLIDDNSIYSDAIKKMLDSIKIATEKIRFLTISKVNSIDDIKSASWI